VRARNGSIIGSTSYNYTNAIGTSTESATFDYGPDRRRWRMVYSGPSGVETTYYATPMFEAVATGAVMDYRHYIYANGRPVVVINHTSAGAVNVRSLLTDHQGSISTIASNATGAAIATESFTPYGNRREASTWSGTPTSTELNTMNSVTREGYTFQTVLGSMGLNHMNGRIEDSVTGRFLSPDPHGIIRGNTQSWNRYSYVNNNPLTSIDPTGFDGCKNARCLPNNPTNPSYSGNSLAAQFDSANGIGEDYSYGGGGGPSGLGSGGGPSGAGGGVTVAVLTTGPNDSNDSDPELQPIVVTAVRLNDDGTPQLPAQVIGQGLPTSGQGLTQRQIDTAVAASAEQELALQNAAAARAAGQTAVAEQFDIAAQLAVDKYIDGITPGGFAPIQPAAHELQQQKPIDVPEPNPPTIPP
jgi:RHS repeat-associated protein